ncbi:ankyrin repeat-containing domain protein [Geopyxis carbonaria]|nr:ankyrin repeat-containing domain protein [Geopyxis carbonaria]
MAEQNTEVIHAACREGKFQLVDELLTSNPKLAYRVDSDGRLPIHWACSFNHKAILQLLTQQQGFDVDAQDGSGWTPLMIACSVKEGEEMVDLLLGRGADINVKSETALHFCASKSRLDTTRKLLAAPQKASVRVKDQQGQYPLHRAAAAGASPLVTLLLDSQSPINARDRSGLTPLHHACAEGHGDTAALLIKRGADSSILDHDNNLPIALAPDRKVAMFIINSAKEEGIELAMPQ